MDCIFCKIVAGEIPAQKVYETETVLAFDDISPAAPVHTLIIPKQHIPSVNEITPENSAVTADLFLAAKEVAKIKGIDEGGYRLIVNTGKAGGQEVFHIHLHVLGGKESMGPMVVA